MAAVQPRYIHGRAAIATPQLDTAPSPSALEAHAPKLAKALKHALALRDDRKQAQRVLREAEARVRQAQARDRARNAEAVAKNRSAVLEDTHAAAAREEVETAQRRYEALTVALQQAIKSYTTAAEPEAERLVEAARRQRQESAAAIREASAQVVAAIDNFESLLGAAKWASNPTTRRWKTPLRTGKAARTNVGELLESLDALGDWVEAQPLPGEEQPEPGVAFGWGQLTSPLR
jgi:hypothetical protein